MQQMSVKSPDTDAVFHLVFSQVNKGHLITGYESTVKAASTAGQQDRTVHIEYQEIEGLELPQTLIATFPAPAAKLTVQFKFEDYQIKREPH